MNRGAILFIYANVGMLVCYAVLLMKYELSFAQNLSAVMTFVLLSQKLFADFVEKEHK